MKRTLSRLLLIPACILLGYGLLVLSYLIPESAIHANLAASYEQLAKEETYVTDSFSGRLLDNFSDSLILLECGYSGEETPFVKAANSPFFSVNWKDPHASVGAMKDAAPSDLTLQNYSRFWHGYQVILRPLLLIFNYQQIRVLNTVLLFALLALILFLMIRKSPGSTIPFVLSVLLLAPTAVGQNIHFSGVIYVALITVLLILWNPKQLRSEGKIEVLFLLSGIAVAFLDLLSAPTVALAFPLAMLCVLEKDRPLKPSVFFRCILFWGIGYALMWAGKWVIAYLQNGSAFITETVNQMKFRSGTDTGSASISRIDPLILNFRHLCNTIPLNIAVLLYLVYTLIRIFRKGLQSALPAAKKLLPLAITALLPLVWMLLLSNHSQIHFFFTYRTLVPCVFCVLCAMDHLGSPSLPDR